MSNLDIQPEFEFSDENKSDEVGNKNTTSDDKGPNDSVTNTYSVASDFPDNTEIINTNFITRSGNILNPDVVQGLKIALNLLIERGADNFNGNSIEISLRELYGKNKISDKYYYTERVWERTLPDIRFVEKNPEDDTYHLLEKEYQDFIDYYSTHRLPVENSEPLPGSVEIKPDDLGMLLFFKKLYENIPKYYPPDDNTFNDHYGTKRLNGPQLLSMLSFIFDINQREPNKGLNKILNAALSKSIIEEATDFPAGRQPIKWYYYNDNKIILPSNYSKDTEGIEIEKFIKKSTEYFK